MYLLKEQLRSLRGLLYSRCSSMYEYHLCSAIIDARLCFYNVDMKFGDKYYPNIDFAKIDLDCAIDMMLEHYNITEL